METAYLFKKLTKVQRDALIERKVAFVSVPDQIYLPFLGVMMRNNFRKEPDVNTDKMMPATQSLFLYILYHGNGSYILKKQAAEDLSLTRTSITRASRQLKEMGLIAEERHGKEIRMTSLADGRELFEPQFLLGITATPKRMDGEDVFALFDQNVPYELRLRDAIVNRLVVPFHYYVFVA